MESEPKKSSTLCLSLEALWNVICFRIFLVEVAIAAALAAGGWTGHVAIGAQVIWPALAVVAVAGYVTSCLNFRADGIPLLDGTHVQFGAVYAGMFLIALAPVHFVLTGLLLTSVVIVVVTALVTLAIAAYLGSKVGV